MFIVVDEFGNKVIDEEFTSRGDALLEATIRFIRQFEIVEVQ